ncbi:hypothetical protein RJT34_20657 [Clitoria ternatea]|uniref:Uncharacterized protein n=1 Tax=Clitoria ternatea TaxID=43366 RepID=A0AAN9P612_CLITE
MIMGKAPMDAKALNNHVCICFHSCLCMFLNFRLYGQLEKGELNFVVFVSIVDLLYGSYFEVLVCTVEVKPCVQLIMFVDIDLWNLMMFLNFGLYGQVEKGELNFGLRHKLMGNPLPPNCEYDICKPKCRVRIYEALAFPEPEVKNAVASIDLDVAVNAGFHAEEIDNFQHSATKKLMKFQKENFLVSDAGKHN